MEYKPQCAKKGHVPASLLSNFPMEHLHSKEGDLLASPLDDRESVAPNEHAMPLRVEVAKITGEQGNTSYNGELPLPFSVDTKILSGLPSSMWIIYIDGLYSKEG